LKSKEQKTGFLPCFSKYDFRHYPIENLYCNNTAVSKVKQLVSALIDSNGPEVLSKQGIGKGGIKVIRPTSKEAIELIKSFEFPYNIYRIDYGDTPFRIIFGLYNGNGKRIAYIFAFDMVHKTLPQKKHQKR